ncbi:low affinity penicillin binding protein [Nonlabens ulvanivorans]|nr:low affinity penicillin binding protein [Nonlabens ulvanivorans]
MKRSQSHISILLVLILSAAFAQAQIGGRTTYQFSTCQLAQNKLR